MNVMKTVKNLEIPKGKTDVVLDTDAFNEIDDQFAIAYMLRSQEKLNVRAIYAAPFENDKSDSAKDGMEKSYNEILKLLGMLEENKTVLKGSDRWLGDEETPVISPAAEHLAKLAEEYSPENPLYVVEIAAITTVASALLINPRIAEKLVIVWLGGNSVSYGENDEFNMRQDVAAARVVFKSGAALVQLPCRGAVDTFRISRPELLYWLKGKNELCDYLADIAVKEGDFYADSEIWTRVIWDVTAVAWLLNDNERFMRYRITERHIPTYDLRYTCGEKNTYMNYVYAVERDKLMEDLIKKLTEI